MSKQYTNMTYRLSDGRETTYKVELLPESEWPSKEREIWFKAGVTGERQRIIKLLEDPATMSNWWAMPDKSLGLYGNLKNYVIELIKGETSEASRQR